MKKIFLLLILLTGLVFIFGCENKTTVEETIQDDFPKTALISSFSSIREFRTFKISSTFYKVELNKNTEYITDGDTSAKFTIRGNRNDIPEISIFTSSQTHDFSKVCAVSVDVFNTDDKDHKVNVGFTSRLSGYDRKSYIAEEFVLNPGYNKLILEIDVPTAHNICYINNVEYITFTFENSYSNEWVAYFDNLRAHYTEKEVEIINKNYEEDELLFFDNKLDRYFISIETTFAQATDIPEIIINRDPRYIKSGNGSLKITTPVNTIGGSPSVCVIGEPLSRLDFSNYTSIQMSIMLDKELNGSRNINTGVYDINDVFLISGEHLRNVDPDLENDPNHFDWGKPIPKNKWFTLELKISQLEEAGLDLEKINKLIFYIPTVEEDSNIINIYIDEIKLVR